MLRSPIIDFPIHKQWWNLNCSLTPIHIDQFYCLSPMSLYGLCSGNLEVIRIREMCAPRSFQFFMRVVNSSTLFSTEASLRLPKPCHFTLLPNESRTLYNMTIVLHPLAVRTVVSETIKQEIFKFNNFNFLNFEFMCQIFYPKLRSKTLKFNNLASV